MCIDLLILKALYMQIFCAMAIWFNRVLCNSDLTN